VRAARILIIAVLSCLGLVGVTASPAAACTCAARGTGAQVSATDVVFVGTLTDSEQDGDDTSGTVSYTFDVDDVYKGDAISPVQVTTGVQGSACGLPDLRVRREYVVFAFAADGDELGTGSCSGTTKATPALVSRLTELAGPPSRPAPAPDDGVPGLLIVAGLACVVGSAGLLLVRARRRRPPAEAT
jgi:hypothetical protein